LEQPLPSLKFSYSGVGLFCQFKAQINSGHKLTELPKLDLKQWESRGGTVGDKLVAMFWSRPEVEISFKVGRRL